MRDWLDSIGLAGLAGGSTTLAEATPSSPSTRSA